MAIKRKKATKKTTKKAVVKKTNCTGLKLPKKMLTALLDVVKTSL